MVRVEGVPQPKRIGKAAQGEDRRVSGAVVQQEAPTGHVQEADAAEETGEPPPLAMIE
jgi:hypothetical protein